MNELPQPRPPATWTRLALLASIGLNLVFAGLWFGDTLRVPWRGPPPGGPLHMMVQRLESRLGPEARARVEALRAEVEATFAAGGRRGAAARIKIAAILVAEPFDRSALVAEVDQLIGDRARNDGDIVRRIAAVMATLSPAERQAVAETIMAIQPPAPPR